MTARKAAFRKGDVTVELEALGDGNGTIQLRETDRVLRRYMLQDGETVDRYWDEWISELEANSWRRLPTLV